MVEVDAEGFDTADVEDSLPDWRLDFGDVTGVALAGEDVDKLTSFGLKGGHERLDAGCGERLYREGQYGCSSG